MARVELIMPKMGESVSEATIISWSKKIGDMVELDETIIEIATDKVDSEVPSTHQGKLVEMLFGADDVVKVGEPFAIIETEAGENDITAVTKPTDLTVVSNPIEEVVTKAVETTTKPTSNSGDRFYSPLVRSMASQEKIAIAELDTITGTGKDDRVTKSDMLVYLQNRGSAPKITVEKAPEVIATQTEQKAAQIAMTSQNRVNIPNTGDTEIVEMDRMRKLISAHMTMSKQTSAHITSFVEADMTNVVNWRDSIKDDFKRREGQNITFTPIIIEASIIIGVKVIF